MKRLLGRTALVTGASRGIGAAVALMPKLLERAQRGLIESRRAQAGALPTVQEFAAAIVDAAADARRPNGLVSFVGPTD